ncbi:hypothetical protein NDU88_007378 [Pleurodeles waltl]|uniref:Uncharacterized protein n=1 Tax=Pleurodeles waltl TaxID=8319 RepID=A0AAV7NWH9_PLEWA|nr:hypothetical protein NDU88_007378 [Pleurodeles waltl]
MVRSRSSSRLSICELRARVNMQENRCQDTKHETARRGEFRRPAVHACSRAWQETKREPNAVDEATVRVKKIPK